MVLLRRSLVSAITLVLMSSVAACSGGDDTGGGGGGTGGGADADLAMADAQRAAPEAGAAARAGAALDAFAAGLYAQVAGEEEGNVVLSPYSVAYALAMTRAGAVGDTADEIDAVLHSELLDDLHASFNALDQDLATRSGKKQRADGSEAELNLRTANSLWGQRGFAFESPFLELLASQYGAGMHLVDFIGDTEGARRAINGWVGDQTNDKIPELLAEGILTDLTRLVLTNAIYLKAPWELPFAEVDTEPAPFHLLDGSTVEAPLMSLRWKLGHSEGDGWQAVELPYAGNELSMVVVVPEEGAFAAVEAALDGDLLAKVVDGLTPSMVDLRFPSFEFRTQASLKDALTALGMPLAFDPDNADLSGMTKEDRLYVSAVVHEAFIAVDEKGTEAAAATAVVGMTKSALPDLVQLTVDRPFLFLIRDSATGAPLFMGRVLDPTS